MNVIDERTFLPASLEQEAIWAADRLTDGPPRYQESWTLRLSGELDVEAAIWAIRRVIDRHDALRTIVRMRDEELVQEVLPRRDIDVAQRSCQPAALEAALREIVDQPLGQEPVRATLLRLSPREHVFVLQVHHIVVDATALAVIDQEFAELYRARVEGREPQLQPAPQFGEYARGQRASRPSGSVLAYWRERLRDAPTQNAPPPDRARSGAVGGPAGQVSFPVGEEIGRIVRRACRSARTTPFTVFAAALGALIGSSNDTTDVIIGTPVSRRGAVGSDGMIGCLTDLLPLRLGVGRAQSIETLLRSTHATVWEAIAHKDITYSDLLAKAAPRRVFRQLPLCQTVLVVDDVRQQALDLPGLRAERLRVPLPGAKFDLCLEVVVDHGRYHGLLDYACDLYDRSSAERIAGQLLDLLSAFDSPAVSLEQSLRTLAGAMT